MGEGSQDFLWLVDRVKTLIGMNTMTEDWSGAITAAVQGNLDLGKAAFSDKTHWGHAILPEAELELLADHFAGVCWDCTESNSRRHV